jgi:hypothetical protein
VNVVAEALPDRGFPRYFPQPISKFQLYNVVRVVPLVCQATDCAIGFTDNLLPLHAVAALGQLLDIGSAELELTLLCVPEPDDLLESSTNLQSDHVARIDGHQLGHFVGRSSIKVKNWRCEAGNPLSPLPVAPKRLVKPRMFASLLAADPEVSLLSALERSRAAAVV